MSSILLLPALFAVFSQHSAIVKASRGSAATEGRSVNLQRAHLMVNYDLPWNPNRLEQRFGRIGVVFHRNRNVETDQKKLGREWAKSYDMPEPEMDLSEDEEPEDGPLFWRSDKH